MTIIMVIFDETWKSILGFSRVPLNLLATCGESFLQHLGGDHKYVWVILPDHK